MIGYAQVDLHTIVAGPVAHDLPLMKKVQIQTKSILITFTVLSLSLSHFINTHFVQKKEAIIPVKGARIQFYVEMRCTSEAQILLSDVSCHGLRLAQNRPTPKWKNDVFLQIQLLPKYLQFLFWQQFRKKVSVWMDVSICGLIIFNYTVLQQIYSLQDMWNRSFVTILQNRRG